MIADTITLSLAWYLIALTWDTIMRTRWNKDELRLKLMHSAHRG